MSSSKILLAALLAGLVGTGCARTQAKPAEAPPDEVLVGLPTSEEVTDYEEFIGHTDAMYSVEVRARVNGYLDKVNFNDGDEVEKGKLLFEIDARPYQAAYENQAALVKQGDAHLTTAGANKARADQLLQRNAMGREEFDQVQGAFAEARAAIGSAKAMLDTAQLNLDWTRVTAPISGRLSRRLVDPGNMVQADTTPLTTIVSLDPIYAYFDVDERTLLRIRRLIAEGRVKSRTEEELPVYIGLSDEEGFPHRGTINFSDNRVDASTGTLRLRGILDNPKPRLFSPGLFVRVRLPIGKPHRSILLTEQAIGTDQGRKFIYVVNKKKVKDPKTKAEHEGEVVEYRQIEVGTLNHGMRVVDKGLALGERVVVSGLQRVRPNKEVRPRLMSEVDPANGGTATATASTAQPVVNLPTPTANAAGGSATH